jgi:antitoxin component YwqK of YwqJK toxin-antitoxin module
VQRLRSDSSTDEIEGDWGMWRKASLTLATIALALAGAVVLFASGEVSLTTDAFPDRTGIGIGLPDSKYEIEQRITEYRDDNRTPKTTTRLYSNGEMGVDHHRKDGTIESRELFYPEKADGTRQLKVTATIGPDGATYLSDTAFYPDGKKQRQGILRTDKSYQIASFYEDGLHTHVNQLVGPKGEPLFEAILRLDGSVEQMAQQNENSFDVTTYTADSKAIKTVSKAKYWSRETTYHADGKTPKTDFLMESYKTTASYYAPNGKLTQKREFTNWQMVATFFKDGVPSYTQTWHLLNPDAVKPEQVRNYRLMSAAVLDAEGRPSWRVVLDEKTQLPVMIEIGAGQASYDMVSTVTRKWYGKDGYLELMLVKKGEYGPEISRTEYSAADGVKADEVPAYLREPVPFEVPPKPVPPPQPPMYH